MTVRTRYRIEVGISSDPNNETKDLGNRAYEVVNDAQDEGGSWKYTIPGSTNNVSILPPGIATARCIVIRTQPTDPTQPCGQIDIKKQSVSGEAWSIIPLGNAKEAHMSITTDGITALYASNLATVSMDVTITISGA